MSGGGMMLPCSLLTLLRIDRSFGVKIILQNCEFVAYENSINFMSWISFYRLSVNRLSDTVDSTKVSRL